MWGGSCPPGTSDLEKWSPGEAQQPLGLQRGELRGQPAPRRLSASLDWQFDSLNFISQPQTAEGL